MKKKLALLPFLLLCGSLAYSQTDAKSAPMTGVWSCNLKVDGGSMPDIAAKMDLKQDGKDVTGTGSYSGGSGKLKGTYEDGAFKMQVVSDSPWTFEGKVDNNKTSGNWGVPSAGLKGTFGCSKPAAEESPLAGLWKCVSKFEGAPDGEFTLKLELNGETVTGVGANAQGEAPLKGTFKDGKLLAKIDTGQVVFELDGKVESGKISGTMNIPAMQAKGTFQGSKN